MHIFDTIQYDIAQRPSHISSLLGPGLLVTYTYDANSNRTSSTLGNGVRTDYTFNLANQVTSVITRRSNVVLSRFDYTYYLNGNVQRVSEQYQNTALNRTIFYTYDAVGRLTQEQVTGSGAQTRIFTYDSRGNRTRMEVTGSNANYTVTYAYDLSNRLLTETRTGSGVRTTQFTYDANGNQTRATTGSTVETRTYNVFNQLKQVIRPGMVASYSYRADGLRNHRVVNDNWVFHVWNNGQIVMEQNASGQTINVFQISLVTNHRIRSVNHGWYHFNARGDVVQRTDGSGNVIQTYRYDAFGNAIWPEGQDEPADAANNNPFRFAGEYWDWERGEYYLRARSYSPRKGRFTSPDPFWNVGNMQSSNAAILQSSNLFVYVMNNPLRWIDPLGLYAMTFNMIDDCQGFGPPPARGTFVQGVVTGATNHVNRYIATFNHFRANPVGTAVNMYVDMVTAPLLRKGSSTQVMDSHEAALRAIGVFGNMRSYGVMYGAGMHVGDVAVEAAIMGASAAVSYVVGKAARYVAKYLPRNVDINRISPNPLDDFMNPRVGPSGTAMRHHLNHIRQHGQIESPLDVRQLPNGNFEIINGHHRWAAAQRMGLNRIPVRVIE